MSRQTCYPHPPPHNLRLYHFCQVLRVKSGGRWEEGCRVGCVLSQHRKVGWGLGSSKQMSWLRPLEQLWTR